MRVTGVSEGLGYLFRQEALNLNIFIDQWSVNANTITDQLPLHTLFRCRAQKAWKPLQRDRDLPAIGKNNMQCILCKGDIYRKRLNFFCQNAHPVGISFLLSEGVSR